jgi:hypothetical protein
VRPIAAPTIHRLLGTGSNALAAPRSTLPNPLLITIAGTIGTVQVVNFSGPLFPAFPAFVAFETPVIFTAHSNLEASEPSKASPAFEQSMVLKAPEAFEIDILDELRLRAATVENDAALVAKTLSVREEKG